MRVRVRVGVGVIVRVRIKVGVHSAHSSYGVSSAAVRAASFTLHETSRSPLPHRWHTLVGAYGSRWLPAMGPHARRCPGRHMGFMAHSGREHACSVTTLSLSSEERTT